MATEIQAGPAAAVERLRDAISSQDLEAMVGCFQPGVTSRQPLHPGREFTGNENIRQNWTMIFGGVPDIRAEVLRCAVDGDTAWAEWRWSGTSRDGSAFEMRGATVQQVVDGLIADVALYMEPVEQGGAGNAAAIAVATGASR